MNIQFDLYWSRSFIKEFAIHFNFFVMGFSLLFMQQFIVGFDVFIIYLSVNITIFVEGMEDSCLILRSSP